MPLPARGYDPIVLLLLSLLVVPGLILLALLMERLELLFAHREVADEISRLIELEAEADELEQRVATAAQRLFATRDA